MAAFVEVCFSIRKQLKKNKINEEIALAIICLFHVQIEEPASSSIFKKNWNSFHARLNNHCET